MRCLSLVAAAAFSLLGCASAPPPALHGYFLDSTAATPAFAQAVAADAVKKLAVLYPPAHTRLQLLHPMQDDFGAALTTALRSAGYAIAEPVAIAAVNTSGNPAVQTVPTTLAYIVDQQAELGLWRLTLLLKGQPLSRLYRLDAGAAVPASNWIRKE